MVFAPGQLSVPTGAVKVTMLPQEPKPLLTLILAGQTIVGEEVSWTVTVKEQESSWPLAAEV